MMPSKVSVLLSFKLLFLFIFFFQNFSQWGRLGGSAMALSQGICSGLMDWCHSWHLTDFYRPLTRQHSPEYHARLTYYLAFRNEIHLFHFGNLSGWSQKQFEIFLHGYGSSCLNQATQRCCCLMQLNLLLLCSSAGAAQGGSVALWFAQLPVLTPISCWHTGSCIPRGSIGGFVQNSPQMQTAEICVLPCWV